MTRRSVSILDLGPAAQRQVMAAYARSTAKTAVPAERKSKYGAKKTVVDGITFDSGAEAKRYDELKKLERAGEISGLSLQPAFPIAINGNKVAEYRADFAYFRGSDRVIEDVKGVKTPVYRLKKKLVEALYAGVRIVEVMK